MAAARPETFVAIDFETANQHRTSACSVGLVRVEGDRVVAREHRLIRPPTSDFEFTHIHRITWEQVRREPAFADVWREVEPVLDGADYLAAHNAPFDRGVLEACLSLSSRGPFVTPFLCTVRLARRVLRLSPANLPAVCRHLGIALEHHDALSDAEACARIVLEARRRDPEWRARGASAPSEAREAEVTAAGLAPGGRERDREGDRSRTGDRDRARGPEREGDLAVVGTTAGRAIVSAGAAASAGADRTPPGAPPVASRASHPRHAQLQLFDLGPAAPSGAAAVPGPGKRSASAPASSGTPGEIRARGGSSSAAARDGRRAPVTIAGGRAQPWPWVRRAGSEVDAPPASREEMP